MMMMMMMMMLKTDALCPVMDGTHYTRVHGGCM